MFINQPKTLVFINSAKMIRLTLIFCVWCVCVIAATAADPEEEGFLVRKENTKILVSTENGEIAAARIASSYLVHCFTMDPNSLFLPLILHSDMVFYVHTGSGKLSWSDESELRTAELRRGDVYRLKAGAVFFIQSNLETETRERQRLRIISIFANSNTHHLLQHGPYSSIRDMVLGFDKKVLQAAFKVSDEVIEDLLNGTRPPAIIHGVSKGETKRAWELELESKFLDSLLGSNIFELNKKKGKSSTKLFNIFKEDKDFKNCNGWSTAVTRKKLSALKGTGIGVFMVNLTAGSMMGPHWNPEATEIAVVLQGRGMIRVVCPGILNETDGCSNMSFEVEEGDIFAVPRFHPMAQMAFNNETFVFMGFSNSAKKNHPQFFAGQASVLRALSKDVLATSFNVRNKTMDQLLASQQDSVILSCISCAEEELRIVEEEREKEREEAREREEEEARKEEESRRKEEEEAREREEEEAKRQEEERRKREEEEEEEARRKEEEEAAREREEEEAKRREEERQKREEEAEEEAREREEEEAKRREEEQKRQEEEEAARHREEEEAKRQEEERQKREQEAEEEAREREEEEAKRQEEEGQKREQEAEEAAREREEEEARRREEEQRRQEKEEARRKEEEEAREREEEEAKRQEEERKRREEEEEEEEEEERRREEEEARQEEEEERERREAEARKRKEEKRRRREEERRREREEEQRGRRSEEEAAAEEEKRREEEEERAEEAARRHHERKREREREEQEGRTELVM